MYTLYFADKVTVFAAEKQNTEGKTLYLSPAERLTREQLLEHFGQYDRVTVVSSRYRELFDDFCRQFTWVEAAGGLVENAEGQWLMIHRNGRWDLPKGHLEAGESLPQCAAREVGEECGLDTGDITVGRFICSTLHFYFFRKTDRWEIKRTWWFRMSYTGRQTPAPQTEEGITAVEWMTQAEAKKAAAGSFRTIAEVLCKTE